MLSQRQRKAIRLMFRMSDEDVAKELCAMPWTIARWRRSREFRKALAAADQAIKSATARISSLAALEAAKNLHKLLSEGKDLKLSLDTLKASGAFDEKQASDEELLADFVTEVEDED